MRIKRTLFIFLSGTALGSALTWFYLEEPERRDELIDAARERWDQLAETVQEKAAPVRIPEGMATPHAYGGLPVDVSYPGDLLILENTGFVVGYDEERNNPAWVAYRVFEMDALESKKRPSGFRVDSRTESAVSHDDYTHSGYDRGHLAPNYAIVTRYGREAQLETFLMSNIVPQDPDLNRGPWRVLEETISGYGQAYEEVWVVTGPIYDAEAEYIGPLIEVPDAFYKIVIDEAEEGLRILAFNFPQEVGRRADPEEFLTTVDAIEELVGLDFLSGLPDDLEERLESTGATQLW
jgi:endonuclease G